MKIIFEFMIRVQFIYRKKYLMLAELSKSIKIYRILLTYVCMNLLKLEEFFFFSKGSVYHCVHKT